MWPQPTPRSQMRAGVAFLSEYEGGTRTKFKCSSKCLASSMTTPYVPFCSSIFFTNFFFFLLLDNDDDDDHHRCRLLMTSSCPPPSPPSPSNARWGWAVLFFKPPPLTTTNTHPLACDCVPGWAFLFVVVND